MVQNIGNFGSATGVRLNLDQVKNDAKTAVEMLRLAASQAQRGQQWEQLVDVSAAKATDVLAALGAFLEGKTVLTRGEAVDARDYADALNPIVNHTEQALAGLEDAIAGPVMQRGGVMFEREDFNNVFNEHRAAEVLLEKADELKRPTMMKYFGTVMVAEPGLPKTLEQRKRDAIKSLQRPDTPDTTLDLAQQRAKRAADIGDAQRNPRGLDAVRAAGQQKAIAGGWVNEDGSAQPFATHRMVVKSLMNQQDIQLYATDLMTFALDLQVVKALPPGQQIDAALREAKILVDRHGRDDATVNKFWYAALEDVASAARG